MIIPPFLNALPQHATLSRIVVMRLVELIVQLLAIALAQFWLGIDLPLGPMLVAMALLAAFNGWTWRRMQRADPAGEIALFLQLLADIAVLTVLLYFSGGATNPFVSFYLPVLAVAAAILPWWFSFTLAAISLACYSGMTSLYVPLRVMDPDRAVNYHLAGMWANFALSAALITWFVARMSGALRERDAQLAAARERHAQSERMTALGMQAANAAHGMGTPLSTVAMIAEELKHEAQHNAALAAYLPDLQTVEMQIALCKSALERMSMRGAIEDTSGPAPIPLGEWLGDFVEQWRLRYPATRIETSLPAGGVRIGDTHAIGQILLILLDNAGHAAAHAGKPVKLSLEVAGHAAMIRIHDQGLGIAPGLLKRLGYEPVKSTSGGQGIGLMLAFAGARQCGAKIELASRPGEGTIATLTIALA